MAQWRIMARFKETNFGQGLIIPVNLSEQIVEGTYEHTMKTLIDEKLDLSAFDRRYNNDETGAAAISPKILLKAILYCYNMGVISSRGIAAMCRNHMVAKALAEDTEPHCTTISNFVSSMGDEIGKVFATVLLVCVELKLIGGETYALDGLKLPSNASKEWSGTIDELQKKHDRIKKISDKIVKKHRKNDLAGKREAEADARKLEKLEKKAAKILEFINGREDRAGAGGEAIKSNVTDNESGKLHTSRGTIQGYTGIAMADGKSQVIVAASAHGTVAEGQFFGETLKKAEANVQAATGAAEPLKGATVLADAAFFSEENLQAAKAMGVDAIIPDQQHRSRDGDLKDGERREGKERFDARHFSYDEKSDSYERPNGKRLVSKGTVKLNRNEGRKYESKASDCAGCPFFPQCVRVKKDSDKRQKAYRTLYIPILKHEENLCQQMRERIDTPECKEIYSQRLGLIEPVFANIAYCKGMNRFTLRGEAKVNVQWLLYCIVHNIGKCSVAIAAAGAKKAGKKAQKAAA